MEAETDSMALQPAPSRSPVAEEWARLTEAEFSALLDAAVDGIVIMDAEGWIEGFNASAERLFGFSPEEVMGRNVGMLMSEACQKEEKASLVPEPASGRPDLVGSRELVARRRDGSTFPVELAVGEVRSQVPRFVGIIRDISERKEIERRLTQREHELRLTIENAPIPISTVGLDGVVLSANPSFCKMLGYTQHEIVRMTFRDFTFPDDLPLTVTLMEEALRGEGDTYTYQKRYVHKDGRVVHVVLHNGVVRDEQGRPEMIVVQVEDLTERMKAEEEAREHRERLAHVDRLNVMGEMAASIAHEINQPLSAIANYTNAAYRRVSAGRLDGEKLSASLMKIDEQAQRAGEVVRRLRNLVKKRESQRELLDINELVRDSLRLAEVDARIHDVVVETSFTESPSRVLADPVQIEQVILNLLRNAIDAMGMVAKDESRLMVRTEEHDNFVEVSVCDRGTGITKVHEKHLFEPFFTTKVAGMGMGLSISHSIVSAHGGRFWFTRNPERGVTFRFSLPKATGWLQ